MLRLKDIPETETGEVIAVAQQLYERERDEAERTRSLSDAAEEFGLPAEYLERAAREVHQRRVAAIHEHQRKRRNTFVAIGTAAVVAGGLMFFVARTAIAPTAPATVATVSSPVPVEMLPNRWNLDTDGRSRATTQFGAAAGRSSVSTIKVEQFRPDRQGRFFVNLRQTLPAGSLAGRSVIQFDARGQGLGRVRLDLENGPLERWRGPALPVGTDWSTLRVPLQQLERQTRTSVDAPWRLANPKAPADVQRLSIKVGERINDASAKGEISVDAVRVE